MARPSGTVVFLFTDIEGSTFRWEAYPDAMKAAVRRHDVLVRASIERCGGTVFKTVGDAFCAAFSTLGGAAAAALDAQAALAAEDWHDVDELCVRMAIHAGSADERDGDYFGSTVNRVGRLLVIGKGGQILLSSAAKQLAEAGLPSGSSLRDLGEHGLKDLATPERVFQLVAPGIVDVVAPLRSIAVAPHNLPLQTTSFVGRSTEIDEIRHGVETERLLTLVGPGGVGKTRLAVQVAAALVDRFADGVWLIELADIREPDLVAGEFASVLRASVTSGKSVIGAVAGALAHKNALLIVDNCEHVIGAAAAIVDAILHRAKDVRIIATSRQPLRVPGEFVRRVDSLPVPTAHNLRADAARAHDAVALFEERARAATGNFVLTDENAPAVADICRSLDGIPLAIELAAPKLVVLSPAQLAGRLSERLRVLSGGSRTALRRQQTLRALIDWSHDLLDEREQRVFRRHAPFMGGWTLESAEAVCSGADLDEGDILELLGSLVEKSLVVADTSGHVTRYRFLESIREYAYERLRLSGEESAISARHAGHVAEYVRDQHPRSVSMEDQAWQTSMLSELDNLRAALGWTLEQKNDPQLGLEMLTYLGRWRLILLPGEALHWFELAAAAVAEVDDPRLRSAILVHLAMAASHGGRSADRQIALAHNAIAAARQSREAQHLGRALVTLGLCLRDGGRLDEADAVFREAAQALEPSSDAVHRAILYSDWASNDLVRGELELARERLHVSLNVARAGSLTAANALATLAEVEAASGDHLRARALAREAKASFAALDRRLDLGVVSCNLAAYAMAADAFDEALSEILEALSILRGVGSVYLTMALEHRAVLAALTGEGDNAVHLLGFTDAYFARLGVVRGTTEQVGFAKAQAMLRTVFAADELEARMREGAAMTEEAALSYALAMEFRREAAALRGA